MSKEEFVRMDACDLSDLIEQTYGREYNVAYSYMQDQRKVTMYGIGKSDAEGSARVSYWAATGQETMPTDAPNTSYPDIIEYIMDDLCSKGLLEEGDYLLEFDD